MEELIILQYGSLATLGKRAKYDAQQTGCLKGVTDQTLSGQSHLDELRRDHPGWSTAHHQEWGLFLLEHLLNNAATMQWKEKDRTSQRCPQAQPSELAEVTAPAHPLSGHFWSPLT